MSWAGSQVSKPSQTRGWLSTVPAHEPLPHKLFLAAMAHCAAPSHRPVAPQVDWAVVGQ
jgi:hypothetical protein